MIDLSKHLITDINFFMKWVDVSQIMVWIVSIFPPITASEIEKIFSNLLNGNNISSEEAEKYKTAVMIELCRMNHKRGWTQQFHVGALRNNNARMFRQMGPDTGWDSIGVPQDAFKMSKFLSALDEY